MFDYIDYSCPCPVCGEKVTGFQTKDNEPSGVVVSPADVSNFYSDCDNCGCWIEINLSDKPTHRAKHDIEEATDGEEIQMP